jgi:ribonuclease HII
MPQLIPTFKLEKQKLTQGFNFIIGCDEVGRGCLAGPVVAASVVFDPGLVGERLKGWYKEIRDSKVLSPAKREELAVLIKNESLACGIGVVAPEEIDEINIHHASLLALKKSYNSVRKTLEKLDSYETPERSTCLLVDGKFELPGINCVQHAVINGDALVLSISAASIVAKVYRDQLMVKLHKKFPIYNFAQHKGYATVLHRQALREAGLSPLHRLSFCTQYLPSET